MIPREITLKSVGSTQIPSFPGSKGFLAGFWVPHDVKTFPSLRNASGKVRSSSRCRVLLHCLLCNSLRFVVGPFRPQRSSVLKDFAEGVVPPDHWMIIRRSVFRTPEASDLFRSCRCVPDHEVHVLAFFSLCSEQHCFCSLPCLIRGGFRFFSRDISATSGCEESVVIQLSRLGYG